MQQYNPKEAAKKNNPEQKIITAARNVEYDRRFKKSAEDKINQENPTPQGVFKIQTRSVARQIVEGANELVNKKKKGDISNENFAADMAMVDQMINNLGNFSSTVEGNLAAYNLALKNGTLSYGMDQHDEAVLQAIDKGEVKLALDEEGRVKMEGKANHSMKGNFDVNIYDFQNVPKPVGKIRPINLLLDPYAQGLGLDENGQPQFRFDENGQPVYDTGDYSEHKSDILGFSQDALAKLGPDGIRSYLGDHMNLPQDEIKELSENINYSDEDGNVWANQAESRSYDSVNEYLSGRYKRRKRPHPDAIALSASNEAANIAAEKGVNLPKQEEQIQETEVMQTPQGEVSETMTENITEAPTMDLAGNPIEAEQNTEIVEENVEETENSPLTMKALSAADLIKKYS